MCQLRTPDTTLSSSRILLQAMRSHLAFPLQYASPCRGCYIPRLTLHDTRHTIHVLHNTSHVTCAHLHESHHKSSRILLQAMRSHLAFPLQYASPCRGCYIPRLTLHDTRHTIHVLHNTSHVTRVHLHDSYHKWHVKRHTSHLTPLKPGNA